jgi:hypothetical protein
MKKVAEIKNELDKMQRLIENLEFELDKYRYIIHAYYLKHGSEIQSRGVNELDDNVDIDISSNYSQALMVNCKELGKKGNYQKIKEKLKELRNA